jgi:hypothetical protein
MSDLSAQRLRTVIKQIVDFNTQGMPALSAEQLLLSRRSAALRFFEPALSLATEILWTGDIGAQLAHFHEEVGRIVGIDAPIRYLEFGVGVGSSMHRMSGQFSNPVSEFVGFDSFEGLPEPWTLVDGPNTFPVGTFSTGGALPKIDDSRVRFVRGWFQNTLPLFVRGLDKPDNIRTLVHYDADLYSSTMFILSSLWPVIPDYWFLFDEFRLDEAVALHDFVSVFPVHIEFLAYDLGLMRVFGRMRRTELEL